MLIHTLNKAWLKIEMRRLVNGDIKRLGIAYDFEHFDETYNLIDDILEEWHIDRNHSYADLGIIFISECVYLNNRLDLLQDLHFDSILFTHDVQDTFFKSWVFQHLTH